MKEEICRKGVASFPIPPMDGEDVGEYYVPVL